MDFGRVGPPPPWTGPYTPLLFCSCGRHVAPHVQRHGIALRCAGCVRRLVLMDRISNGLCVLALVACAFALWRTFW